MAYFPSQDVIRHYDLTPDRPIDDAFLSIIDSLQAANWMLFQVLWNGAEGLTPNDAEGIHKLFKQQIAMLAGVYEEYAEREGRREQEAKKPTQRRWTDAAMTEAAEKLQRELIEAGAKSGADTLSIAAAMHIPTAVIEGVVSQLRGNKQPSDAGRAARA